MTESPPVAPETARKASGLLPCYCTATPLQVSAGETYRIECPRCGAATPRYITLDAADRAWHRLIDEDITP